MSDSIPHLLKTRRPFSFAVIGDLHYGLSSPQTELLPRSAQPDSRMLERYSENVEYALEPMVAALMDEDLSFVIQTGDMTAKESDSFEYRAAIRFLCDLGAPVLFARGDKDNYEMFEQAALPFVSKAVGDPIQHAYYTVEVGECYLIILDTSSWNPEGEQARWFANTLKRATSQRKRVFVFGHHPVWNVAKAFYSNRLFCQHIVSVLAEFPVDSYFCGHTHNQSILLHRSGNRPCLQCMGAPIGHSEELPTPLDRVHSLLLGPDEVIDHWPGYLENTAPGWYVVKVDGDRVNVSWHHLSRGIEASVTWQEAGYVDRFWRVNHPDDSSLISRDLIGIRRLSLRFCAWDAIQSGKRVRLNGVDVGQLPESAEFAPRQIDLPPSAISVLDIVNCLEIDTLGIEAPTVGNLQLEGVLPSGRIVRTKPTGELFTWSDRWDPWGLPRLEKVMPGRSLRTLLSFQ